MEPNTWFISVSIYILRMHDLTMVLKSWTVLTSVTPIPILSTPFPPISGRAPFSLVPFYLFYVSFRTCGQTHAYFLRSPSSLQERWHTIATLLFFTFFTENVLWKSLFISSLRLFLFLLLVLLLFFTSAQHSVVWVYPPHSTTLLCVACRLFPVFCSYK